MTENRLPLLAFVIGWAFTGLAVAEEGGITWKVGDSVPEAKATSVEGIPVEFRPADGKLLLVLIDDMSKDGATERTKAAITLYRRFHGKGLNAVEVLHGSSPDQILRLAIRWQIPWPLVRAAGAGEKPSGPFVGLLPPTNCVVDSHGKVLAAGLEGDKAHETIARLLNVSLDSVPMPNKPEPRPEASQNQGQIVVMSGEDARFQMRLGTAEERKEAEPCKQHLRTISMALTEYREEHDGQLPEHLSDLFPKYLQDESVLLCPSKPEPLQGMDDFADPKMKCSYLYEFSPEPRERKEEQLGEFGDRVAIVRCRNHGRWLSLSYGGEIYFSQAAWENEMPRGATLKDNDAKVRRELRILGAALAKYEKAKGEPPKELDELYPDFLKDKSQLTCSVTGKAFHYRFSPEAGGGQKGREAKLKEAQDSSYGVYVPVVRVKGVCENGDVINLSYDGEIYESPERWEGLFR